MDDLFDLLRARTVNEGTERWEVTGYPDFISLRATTIKATDQPAEAWSLAESLTKSIIMLGYSLVYTCRIGVVSDDPTEDEPREWRGAVDLRLASRAHQQAMRPS